MTTAAPVEGESASCRKGRPRDERIDRDITKAALSVLSDHGFERFSVEEVAQRAGVAKTTIYRRFPSRNELIVGALERLNDDLPPPPPTGPVRERLVEILSGVRDRVTTSMHGRILMQVTGESLRDAALVELVHSRVMEPRRERVREVILAGQASGELRPGLEVDAVMALLVGPMLYLGMWSGTAVARDVSVETVVDMALSGMTRASGS